MTPVELPAVLLPALAITAFLTLIARPAVVGLLLLPFRPSLGQVGVVSWAGLRGVASIVFAIMAVLGGASTRYPLFNLVFCIVLLSISIQGTLLPWISARLSMIDHTGDVGKTFNDYQDESSIDFIKVHLDQSHPWTGQTLKDLSASQRFASRHDCPVRTNHCPSGRYAASGGRSAGHRRTRL